MKTQVLYRALGPAGMFALVLLVAPLQAAAQESLKSSVLVNSAFQSGRVAPRWDNNSARGNRQTARQSGPIFNSSLGYLPAGLPELASPPHIGRNTQPVIIIQPQGFQQGFSYQADRSGNCMESRVDRFGTVFRRRVARHNCGF